MELAGLKYLVVGSGLFGAVVAERISSELGEKVLVVEKRDHLGGNCFSYKDAPTAIECHQYGSHIFHTGSKKVWDYVTNFTSFNSYQHKVLTQFKGKIYQMPVNLATLNSFYNINLRPFEAEGFLKAQIKKSEAKIPDNLEEKAVSMVGRPLYKALIQGYTMKQWATDPRKLDPKIITRIPVRFNYDPRYFTDPWQGIPINGYSALFESLLSNSNIEVSLNTDFFEIKNRIPETCKVIFSGPIDHFFNYKYGHLNWRSLRFETSYYDVEDYQGTSVVNYADMEVPYTRIHEFRHYHPEREYNRSKTVVYREYPVTWKTGLEPYYPVGLKEDQIMFEQYLKEAKKRKNLVLGGRLGLYQYLDMDKVVLQALDIFEKNVLEKG